MAQIRTYQVETVRTICRIAIQARKNDLLVAEVTGGMMHSRRFKASMPGADIENLVQELMDDCLHAIRESFGEVTRSYSLGNP